MPWFGFEASQMIKRNGDKMIKSKEIVAKTAHSSDRLLGSIEGNSFLPILSIGRKNTG